MTNISLFSSRNREIPATCRYRNPTPSGSAMTSTPSETLKGQRSPTSLPRMTSNTSRSSQRSPSSTLTWIPAKQVQSNGYELNSSMLELLYCFASLNCELPNLTVKPRPIWLCLGCSENWSNRKLHGVLNCLRNLLIGSHQQLRLVNSLKSNKGSLDRTKPLLAES